ncbi:ER membrane protein complex subunit 10 [Sitodiplosis mosellana]|uniref:ER membrane protein complex subunit 10 n=1 Tax=Sitodiplosis mosellana TaxID=263140 RepID=UPI002443B6BF|nr:ER membrane protein complex subunit 10 [Sitodiplosis mosellana]
MFSKILILSLAISTIQASILEFDSWFNIDLYHAIDKNNPQLFTPRGNISVTSINSGSFQLTQQHLSSSERNMFKELAEENKFYRLKAIVTHSNGAKSTFLTSSKACAFANSQLNDILWVSVDYAANVLGIQHTVLGSGGSCSGDSTIDKDALEEFNTDVLVKRSELGQVPDTASFIQKLEREREARDHGEVKDHRGFFAKYWMYIVPVAILVLVSGATSPEGGSGGGR